LRTVPFDGFYLYRLSGQQYVEIPSTDELYQEIVASGRVTGNELVNPNATLQPVNNAYAIQPDVKNAESDEYEIGILPREYFQHENEGNFVVTRRVVTIVADDLSSVFGEEYKTGAQLTAKVYAGNITKKEDATDDKLISNFILTTANNWNTANTIGHYTYPTSDIADKVEDAAKPLAEAVKADIVVTVPQGNPNYDIHVLNGTYTVTASAEKYFIDVTWTKSYGSETITKQTVVKFGKTKETAEEVDDIPEGIRYTFSPDAEPTAPGTYTKEDGLKLTGVPEDIEGYAVECTGTLKINVAGEVTIIVANQGINYPDGDAKSAFEAPYVSVSGATVADLAALGLQIAYEKPELGFIKKGAELKLKLGEDGDLIGSAAGVEVKKDQWPWVANYTKVTVKSGKLRVTAADEITLDVVSFNKATYNAEADKADQLIRDYDGTKVKKINFATSKQEGTSAYEVKADQWYSMVLPFDATVRDIQQIFNGFVTVDVLSQNAKDIEKASDIRFTVTVKPIAANTPFVAKTDQNFKFPAANSSIENADGIEIQYPVDEEGNPATASVKDASGNEFIGTYSAFFADSKDDYDFINLSAGNVQAMAVGAYVRPFGAYIKVAEGVDNAHAPVRVIFEEEDGTLTAIDAVQVEVAENAAAEGWYTISGVKLNAQPTEKGIYIFNGKKVAIQ
jgi:hypothetical protein